MGRRANATAIVAVFVALSVVVGSGAFTSTTLDRGAAVDVVGDADSSLGLAAHSGPNGVYAYETAGELAIDLTGDNPNVGGGGPIFGATGRPVNAVETFDDVFNVTNQGTQAVRVWIDHDSPGAVEFYTTTDDHGSIDGEENAITVVPGRTIEVGLTVDTTDAAVGDVLLDGITINAAAEGADAPDVEPDPDPDPDPDPNPDPDPEGEHSIIIGAPQPGAGPGKAYVLASPVAGSVNLADASATFTGEATGDEAGYSVAVAGDVNGDGVADYIVGAPWNDGGGTDSGAAYLVYGPVSGALDLADANATFLGEGLGVIRPTGDGAGFSVAGAGDVNGDGVDDVLVGAPFNETTGGDTGAAYIIYGGVGASAPDGTLTLTAADVTLRGEGGSNAGWSVAGAGDVNGDGFDDIVVGAPERDNVGSEDGAAYLVYGSASLSGTRSLASADATFIGEGSGDRAGRSVAGAGDVNGDGFDDVLVGAPFNDAGGVGGVDAGAAYIVYGGTGTDAPGGPLNLAGADVTLQGVARNDQAGFSVAGAGDINGDGFDDVLVGAPLDDTADLNAGAAYLGYGSATLPGTLVLNAANVIVTGEAIEDFLGEAVAGVGDVDGDGVDDFLVGAPLHDGSGTDRGTGYLFHGGSLGGTISASFADAVLLGEADDDEAGTSVDGGA